MTHLRAHADIIASRLSQSPGLVGRVMRSHHVNLGLALSDRNAVDFPRFGVFEPSFVQAVTFAPSKTLLDYLTGLELTWPGADIDPTHLEAIAHELELSEDTVSTVLRESLHLIVQELYSGHQVSYQGFGRYATHDIDVVQFTPGKTLVATIDDKSSAPTIPPTSRAVSDTSMTRHHPNSSRHGDEIR